MFTRHLKFLFFVLLQCLLIACSNQPLQAWQKQDLARPEMQFESSSPQRSFENHFYFSKESSSGGEGFAGGGCGCN